MNSDTITQLLQKGFRVTLGATATLVEALQDPQRRAENLSKLTSELSQLTAEWETKGATAEVEARNFVDTLWRQQSSSTPPAPSYPVRTVDSPTTPISTAPADVQQDLQELTAQIAAIRAEIERLRNQES